MRKLENYINNNPGRIFLIILLLACPAFFTNLGLLPLFADEPTRANVALEMILSGNFSVPTIGGEYYYNKPPFYNWILAGVYSLTGSYSEFSTRLPAVVPMFLFAITIYYSVNYFLKSKQIAALSGLAFIVNSRMLLYDSMLGHIDIFYSWLTYISFMLIFYFYQRKEWFLLFFCSYLITAVTFLCKGLPSIVFQGFTLIALLTYTGNFRRLFGWKHILSGFVCVALIGAYFLNYQRYNPDLQGYISTIWDQSSQRTAGEGITVWKRISYFLLFPFEHLGHLFPISLLAMFCLHRNFIRGIRENEFLKFLAFTFLANIWVYWLSPETRPRYLLMLYPLLCIILSHAFYSYRDALPRSTKFFNGLLLGLSVLICVSIPAALFAGIGSYVELLWLKVLFLFSVCAALTWLLFRLQAQKILVFAALLVFLRLGFAWFVIPYRLYNNGNDYFRQTGKEIGRISTSKPFFFYQYHPETLAIPFHHRLLFYIESTRGEAVKFSETPAKPGYYFTFDRNLNAPGAVLIKEYQGNLKLYEVK